MCVLCSLVSEFPHNNAAMHTLKLLRLLYDSVLQYWRPYRRSRERFSKRITPHKDVQMNPSATNAVSVCTEIFACAASACDGPVLEGDRLP